MADPVERRTADAAIMQLVNTVLTEQREMGVVLEKHIKDEAVDFERMVNAALAAGYPGGDAEGHRRYHEAAIKLTERKTEFWDKLKQAVASWGLIGVIGALVAWAWAGFLKGPHA